MFDRRLEKTLLLGSVNPHAKIAAELVLVQSFQRYRSVEKESTA